MKLSPHPLGLGGPAGGRCSYYHPLLSCRPTISGSYYHLPHGFYYHLWRPTIRQLLDTYYHRTRWAQDCTDAL